jgi:hypothetical protein
MMPLEKQVVSLDLAKRLKELGVKQESYFTWFAYEGDKGVKFTQIMRTNEEFLSSMVVCPIASAFTVAELGEMLPEVVIIRRKRHRPKELWFLNFHHFTKDGGWDKQYWAVTYERENTELDVVEYLGGDDGILEADTEADARAKMLIYYFL